MSDLLTQGLTLAAYGMGTVFVFLSILVGLTALMSTLVNRLIPHQNSGTNTNEDTMPNRSQADLMRGTATHAIHPHLLVAMTSAVKAYRRDHPNQGDQS